MSVGLAAMNKENDNKSYALNDLEKELRAFRSYGFTSKQMNKSERFLDVMGCVDVHYSEVRRRFICVIKAVLSEDCSEPIIALYGLASGKLTASLTKRREEYCARTGQSVEGLIKRENEMINQLAVLLVEYGPPRLEELWNKEDARNEQQNVYSPAISNNASLPEPDVYAPFYDYSKLIGRKELLKQLDDKLLTETLPVYLHAIGGLGKTEIAKAYCHSEYAPKYDYIFWVSVSSDDVRADIIKELSLNFAWKNKATNVDIEQEFKRFVIHAKKISGKVLLVIDNITSVQQIESFYRNDAFSMLNWKVLVTTRAVVNSEPFLQQVIELDALAKKDCEKLFYVHYKEAKENIDVNRKFLHKMFKNINYHSLLIVLVATTGNSQGYSVKQLALFVDQHGINHKKLQTAVRVSVGGRDYNDAINDIILSLFDLAKISKDEQYILRCFSFLADRSWEERYLTLLMHSDSLSEEKVSHMLRVLHENGWLSLEKNIADKTISFRCHSLILTAVCSKFGTDVNDINPLRQNIEHIIAVVIGSDNKKLPRKEALT